ncbi:MAG TPA: hypothetical protein VEW42_06595 [Candidatus Eisenbacteria bacterium]|nr:hypothetical protein [Candidatus Eisenbacteria bacterium]
MIEHFAQPMQEQEEHHTGLREWEKVTLQGEDFIVKRDLIAPLILNTREGSRDVIFSYDEYHHPETNMQIQVWKLGLNKPQTHPAIVRADYGCPCIGLGSHFTLPGHDCGKQREQMFETVANLGIGVIATVSEPTAAGNGHGSHVVMEQSTMQYEAAQRGEYIPSMQEAYSEMGYFGDKRRHDLTAYVLADAVGQRPVIPVMSKIEKIQHLRDAGMNVVDDMRVDLITDRTESMKSILRRDGYHKSIKTTQPGAYLIHNGFEPTRLTPETYQTRVLAPLHTRASQAAPRRLVN